MGLFTSKCVLVNETTQPVSTDAPKTNSPPTVGTIPQARVADVVDEPRDVYQENAGNRDERWNEHEYYVKARRDLQKHHHEKITKVSARSKCTVRLHLHMGVAILTSQVTDL